MSLLETGQLLYYNFNLIITFATIYILIDTEHTCITLFTDNLVVIV